MTKRMQETERSWILRLRIFLAVLIASLAACAGPTPTLSPTTPPVAATLPPAPSARPTVAPTLPPVPSVVPTVAPTLSPVPSAVPTAAPTLSPVPSATSTSIPTPLPVATETRAATGQAAPDSPVITPGIEIAVDPGQTVAIRANAPRATGYRWELAGEGKISATTGPAIIYTASEQGGGLAILTVTAYNSQGDSPSTAATINIKRTTAIRLDALGIPAGFMAGNPNPERVVNIASSPIACHSGTDCKQYTYVRGSDWGGIMWWPLKCGPSGTAEAFRKVQDGTCGVNVPQAGNLQTIRRLTFWARGQKGGEVVEFKVGAADVSPSPGRSLGEVTLGSDWKQYTINLENVDLAKATALFIWVATDMVNPRGAVFYLDDIQFEGTL